MMIATTTTTTVSITTSSLTIPTRAPRAWDLAGSSRTTRRWTSSLTRFLPINRKSIDLGPGGTGSDDREHDEDEDDGCQVLLF